jgi:hypothetical protein
MLLEESSGNQVVVECKRYSAERKVGVAIVRQLLGVQFLNDFRSAKLVTTSTFTAGAMDVQGNTVQRGELDLELVDIARLSEFLGFYNSELPPLDDWLHEYQWRPHP